jgi:hypothetical protein
LFKIGTVYRRWCAPRPPLQAQRASQGERISLGLKICAGR